MKLFALVDCNNFYASCERVFNPALENQPIVILSNNDGCIIARSNEVKALGIPMGAPLFKYRQLLEQHQVKVFSSNYTLYGDMSARVMGILAQCIPEMEIYSIDEAFLDLSQFQNRDINELIHRIRTKIRQYTGIPVSIGVARTKTLAKIASRIAKKTVSGVFNLESALNPDLALQSIEISDVWGVGRAYSKSLPLIGIDTALDLKQANPEIIRQLYSVVLMRTVKELNGLSCMPLEAAPSPKKAIAVTRSFGKAVTDKRELLEALATYASRGGEKLRQAQQAAMVMQVFWRTSLFSTEQPTKSWSFTVNLQEHTNDSRQLVKVVTDTINQHFEVGYSLKKAGIILLELTSENLIQRSLFSNQNPAQSAALMKVMDSINRRFGKETIKLAATGIKRKWIMRSEKRSPRYTTDWNELPTVKANWALVTS
ncbi:MAG: Y-family DNA polymerase [Cyanobacteria bacterium P01_A01_bin.40]